MTTPVNPFARPTGATSAATTSTGTGNPSAASIGPSALPKPISPSSPFAPRPVSAPVVPSAPMVPRPLAPSPPAATAPSAPPAAFAPRPAPAPAAPLPAATPTASPSASAAPSAPPIGQAGRPSLTTAQFEYLAKLVYELSGMKFEANKSYFLASKLDLRVQALKLAGFDAYITHLNSPHGRTEYGRLVDEVTINETFFFRHEPQLQAFRDNLLIPHAQKRRTERKPSMRIWSAASSTGDELYTLALMLRDAGLWGKDLTWELIGTDICTDALEKARAGLYRKYNIRNIPPALLQAYFAHAPSGPTGETWQLNADVRSSCKFNEGNLMDAARCSALGKFDFIFCRNVLIYFDEPSKEKAVENLANNLHDDGYVLLGHSENIYSQRHILRPVKEFAAAIAYQKAPPGTPKL